MKIYLLTLCLFCNSIVTISPQNNKSYWIECEHFPYDFFVQMNDTIDIYYLNKDIYGTKELLKNTSYQHHIILDMEKMINDFQLKKQSSYQLHQIHSLFQQIIEQLSPNIIFQIDHYIQHDFTIKELFQWLTFIKDKPKIHSYVYPSIIFQNQTYLLSEYPISITHYK